MSALTSEIERQVAKGIAILERGGIVAFPTDTVYGLGAGIGYPEAIKRIYQVKVREASMALPLLCADLAQIEQVSQHVSATGWGLMRRFLPGALTLIVPRSNSVPDIVTGGRDTVAVRIPAHPVPIALAKGIGTPIIGTSANRSGQPSPLTAEEVYAHLGEEVDLIIDGGRCLIGKESTIIDVTGQEPIIVREGAIPKEEILGAYRALLSGKEVK